MNVYLQRKIRKKCNNAFLPVIITTFTFHKQRQVFVCNKCGSRERDSIKKNRNPAEANGGIFFMRNKIEEKCKRKTNYVRFNRPIVYWK